MWICRKSIVVALGMKSCFSLHHVLPSVPPYSLFPLLSFPSLHQVNIRFRWSSGISERRQHESSVRTINTIQTTSIDKENRQRDIHLKCKYPKHKKKHFLQIIPQTNYSSTGVMPDILVRGCIMKLPFHCMKTRWQLGTQCRKKGWVTADSFAHDLNRKVSAGFNTFEDLFHIKTPLTWGYGDSQVLALSALSRSGVKLRWCSWCEFRWWQVFLSYGFKL